MMRTGLRHCLFACPYVLMCDVMCDDKQLSHGPCKQRDPVPLYRYVNV